MALLNRLTTAASFVLAGTFAALPLACAGTFEGEVDGDAVPPLLSGFWLEGDGDGFQISASAASVLDLCGATTAMTREMTEFVAAQADDADKGDDAENVYEGISDYYQEVWERHLPEDFWTVSASVFVEDDSDLVDDYGLGEDADIDFESPAYATFTVCHQEGFPDLDDDGSDDNRTCFPASSGELEVVSFDDQGGIEVTVDAELADPDDLGDDVGDVTATTTVRGCGRSTTPTRNLEDATEDLRDALGLGDQPHLRLPPRARVRARARARARAS